MTRDPQRDPKPGDRWRTEWGCCFVGTVYDDGRVALLFEEPMTHIEFARFARNATFVRNDRTGEVWA